MKQWFSNIVMGLGMVFCTWFSVVRSMLQFGLFRVRFSRKSGSALVHPKIEVGLGGIRG